MDPERILRDHADHIEQTILRTARRRRLSETEAGTLWTFVHTHLAADNYQILRNFQGRSLMGMYLATVIERLSLDFCRQAWKGWHPSLQAQKRGVAAVLLERLILRDKFTLAEAILVAQSEDGVAQTSEELQALWSELERAKNRKKPPLG